jgi:hypothetical protein
VSQGHNWAELRVETNDPHNPTVRVAVHHFAECPPRSGVPCVPVSP